jgi:purine-nucleoside phosphorylase
MTTLYGAGNGAAKPRAPEGPAPRLGAVEAAERILAAGAARPRIGAVLGTGLGGLVDRLADARTTPAADTGWLPRSTATGHAGRIACGTIRGVPAALLQGRVHGYEGHPPEMLTRGVELLAALGVETLLLTNASGGLRPDMQSGELVILTDHLDLVRRPWAEAIGNAAVAGPRPGGSVPYDAALAELAMAATRRAGVAARRGVYALLSGPSYETRAEYRMLRHFGADVVGMSTVPEAAAARHLGVAVVACSVVTNVARPDADRQIETDAEDVIALAAAAAAGAWAILEALADRAAGRTA